MFKKYSKGFHLLLSNKADKRGGGIMIEPTDKRFKIHIVTKDGRKFDDNYMDISQNSTGVSLLLNMLAKSNIELEIQSTGEKIMTDDVHKIEIIINE